MGDLAGLPVLLGYVLVKYAAGRMMAAPRAGDVVAALGIAAKLGMLLVFKYAGFVAQQVELTCATAWLGALCYTIQIYFDFAGCSNMASIGP